ncbi:lactonase family protein [Granulicella arctica]|uniref:6-phosphogluconolactonase (Cycloisomerase 2 family) n=1 Tax=Granulicella arctica TaxID=940613 RepID=A0A7Y9TGX4_9BACT|nr:beta-propeller fold lactonase family protein [Granulicella arctica]NYF79270.1 6-phosphogluconolactonase (cycloisomerase 2 family) [Granulicella arctica]
MAFVVSVAMGLGMTACGGGTIGYMWVLGTTTNSAATQETGQVVGFKIDDYTGNLTSAVGSPFASGGTNPVSIVVKSGGRYVFVINQGVPGSSTTCTEGSTGGVDGNIQLFSVGGDGTLTSQTSYTSQGCIPVWAATDSTGSYLYVLDQRSPAYGTQTTDSSGATVTDLNGSITVFSIASDTGRLSLVTNAQVQNKNGTQLSYFEVGPTPVMMRVSSGGCLFTVDQGDHTVFPYTVGTAGQLTLTTNSTISVTGGTNTALLTSINTSGSYVYLTDSANNLILPYTVGSTCALNTLTGGSVANLALTSNPVYSFTDAKAKYLYVLNQSGTNSNVSNSTISAFTIDSITGKLQGISDSQNPYSVGSGPVCMVEDPTNQYVYTSNHTAGTVTGKIINQNTGQLSDLSRGATFPATGQATCMAVSGNVQ